MSLNVEILGKYVYSSGYINTLIYFNGRFDLVENLETDKIWMYYRNCPLKLPYEGYYKRYIHLKDIEI